MSDLYGRTKAIDEAERQAVEGDKDHCAAEKAKVERQPEGSARRKMAESALAACRARQSTDSNN